MVNFLLLSNSNNLVPNTFQPENNFMCYFNKAIQLPAYCQICVHSHQIIDKNYPKIHYLLLHGLPVQGDIANGEKGGSAPIVGALQTEITDYVPYWVDLNNPSPITITQLNPQLVNQDMELSSGLETQAGAHGNCEILLAYRQDPRRKGTTRDFM
jgi:hypothetical protein